MAGVTGGVVHRVTTEQQDLLRVGEPEHGMSGARRWGNRGGFLLPLLAVEAPSVGDGLIELIAREEDHLLGDRMINELRIGALRRLTFERQLLPGVGAGRVDPSAWVAAFGVGIAAAEEHHLAASGVVADRAPEDLRFQRSRSLRAAR